MKTTTLLLCALWCITTPLFAQQQWIKQQAIPIASLNPEVQEGEDLAWLKQAVKHKKLVVLGEQTHGTHEFSVYKHRLIRYLVQECGYRFVLLETPYFDGYNTDDMLQKDVPADSMLVQHYWCWQHQEMADLLNWMKAYNNGKQRLHFGGFDMQDPAAAISFLVSRTRQVRPQLSNEVQELLGAFNPYASLKQMSTYYALSDSLKQTCRENIAAITSLLQRNERLLKKELGPLVMSELYHAVAVILQAEFQYATFNVLARDSFMAANIRHLTGLYPNDKFIVWTHNLHAGRATLTINGFSINYMGAYLKEMFGNAVLTLGFATYEGACSMRESGRITAYTLTRNQHSAEEMLHHAIPGNYLLPLDNADSFFLQPRPFRVIGLSASPETEFPFDSAPALNFDALVYINQTKPVTSIWKKR